MAWCLVKHRNNFTLLLVLKQQTRLLNKKMQTQQKQSNDWMFVFLIGSSKVMERFWKRL